MRTATWYALDSELKTRKHDAVNVEEALQILRRYVSEVRPFYDTAEEALAATMFGFARSDDEFIEVCVHAPDSIAVKVEFPVLGVRWLLRPWLGTFQHEEMAPCVEIAAERVRQFFELSTDQLRAWLES